MSEDGKTPHTKDFYPLKLQPLFWLSLSFILGLFAGSFFSRKVAIISGAILTIIAIGFILAFRYHPRFELPRLKWQQKAPLTPGWFALLFALGIFRISVAQPSFSVNSIAFYNDYGKAEIIAIVNQPVQINNNSTTLVVKAESIRPFIESYPDEATLVQGKISLSTLNTGEFQYGDKLRIICTPQTPDNFSDFNYQRYLAARRIYTTCNYAYVEKIDTNQGNPILKVIYDIRERAQTAINSALPPDEAALLSGILLGNEDHIAAEVEAAFQSTGTSHIIAISGANFTILISFLTMLLLRHLPRRWVLPISLTLIIFYTILVGGNAAVVRAAIMGGLSVFGGYFGRRNQGLNALSFSAALFVLINPFILWDLGFQLSCVATLGLILFSEKWTEKTETWLKKLLPEKTANRLTGIIGEYVLMTLAAQVFTLPLIAYHFGRISLSSFLINILILPVQPLIMAFGGLSTLLGLIIPFLGKILGWLAWLPLTYTLKIVHWGSTWSWSSITIPQIPTAALWIYFLFAFAYPVLIGSTPKIKRKISSIYLLIGGSTLVLLLWTMGLNQPTGDFHLYLFPLEENTSALFLLPDGKAVLMGRSDSMDSLNHMIEKVQSGYQLSVYLQPDWGSRSFNRTETLTEQYPIHDFFIHPEVSPEDFSQLKTLVSSGTDFHTITKRQTIQLTNEIHLYTVAVRDGTAAFLLEYQQLRILIPNGITLSVLSQIDPDALKDTTVLVLNPTEYEQQTLEDWISYPAQVILINGTITGCPHCINAADHELIELRSDGVGLWLDGLE